MCLQHLATISNFHEADSAHGSIQEVLISFHSPDRSGQRPTTGCAHSKAMPSNTGRVAALVALAEKFSPLERARRSSAISLSGVCWAGISRSVRTVAAQCKVSYGRIGSLHERGARDDSQRIAMLK